ncbi:MAG: hypothetical protein K1X64_20395 [Myxococcaceae bacterium]|nr:hypothetical protein [Myxococcaceae bacterium]
MKQRSPLLVRLPLIVALILGAWLWKGGFGLLPADRELTWKLGGDYASIRRVELQVWDGQEMLTREEFSMPKGAMNDPSQKLSLRKGEYNAKIFVWRDGVEAPAVRAGAFYVGDEKTVTVNP